MIYHLITFTIVAVLLNISSKQWKKVGEQLGIVWTATGGLLGFILAMPIVILGFIYAMLRDLVRRTYRWLRT